jgi:WD40 repeat protein
MSNLLVVAGNDGEAKQNPLDAEKLPPRAVARLGSLAFAHGDTINALAVSPNGKLAASAGTGKYVADDKGAGKWDYDQLTIRLWEVPSGKLVRSIPVPDGPVLALDFSPDGKFLATGAGKKVFVWDLATGKETQRIRLDEYPLLTRFTPDGKHLLINLRNKEILRWDLHERTEVVLWSDKKLDAKLYVRSLDLAPDGSRLAILLAKLPEQSPPDQPISVKYDPPHRLQVLDLPNGKQLFQAEDKDLGVCLALSPDKNTVVFGNERLAFWEIAQNKKLRELDRVPALTESPYLQSLALPPGAARNVRKSWQAAGALSFSPDGRLLVATHGAGDVSLYEADSGKKIGALIHSLRFTPNQGAEIFAFSRDSKILAIGASEVLRLVDTTTGKEISSGSGHRLPISDFRFSPDGKTLATSNEMDVCNWQTKTWQPLSRLDYAPYQHKVVVANAMEKNLLITWVKDEFFLEDLAAGKVLAKFPAKNKAFVSAQFAFDGKTACLTMQKKMRGISAAFYSIPDCKELFQLDLDDASRFHFSPVRNTIIWRDRDETTYFEADATNGKVLRKLKLNLEPADDGLPAIVINTLYSWDGRFFALQTLEKAGTAMRMWDIDTGRLVHQRNYADKHRPSGMDITFDSRLLLLTQLGKDGIQVLELATGKERRPLTGGDADGPRRLATSPVDFTVASGLPGNTALIWDLSLPAKKLSKAQLTEDELSACWRDLAGADAVKAGDAIDWLIQVPGQAVPFLRDHLKPVAPMDAELLKRLIADLGSETLAVRKKASAEIEKTLELAEPGLRQALEKGNHPVETRRRIEQLLEKQPLVPGLATLQALRAVEVLEKIGNRDARQIVETVSRGAPGMRVTHDAVATLGRLDRKK